MPQGLKLLFLSTPVGPLGSGLGGGVELTLHNMAQEMIRRGHQVQVIAPERSRLAGIPLIEVAGTLQYTAQNLARSAPIYLTTQSVIANMWDYARQMQQDYDLLVNFAYDWLPFYLTAFCNRPVAHLVSMGSLTEAMDRMIGQVAIRFPGTVAVHSRAQAATFPFAEECRCLGNGIDLSLYDFCAEPQPWLGWVGRIAREKGVEDAIAAAHMAKSRLKVMGAMPDPVYWEKSIQGYSEVSVEYLGFLSTQDLQKALRDCRALLVTPHWVEAFGNVVIEALACGVPVIAYRRGGPAEIIEDGKTGWLVEPDSIAGLVSAIGKIDQLDRRDCRQQAEAHYSVQAMGDRVEQWFLEILNET